MTAILLCAGRGARLGRPEEKALVPLAGRPLFLWSLDALERCPDVDSVVVVGPVERLRAAAAKSGARKAHAWREGGAERQASVARGLEALPADADLVAVHDAARALVTPELVSRVIAEARAHGAAIAALRVEDTLKRGGPGVEATVPRDGLWRAQTPQVFRRDWIEAAHARAAKSGAPARTDDAGLVEALGHSVRLCEGDPVNFKVTSARDLELAEAWLARKLTWH